MTILFFSETFAFARTNLSTEIAIDENAEQQIRLNFNISLLDVHCDYVSVDVWDSLGTNRQNITKNIEKWQLDESGARRIFSGRNREVREVKNEEHEETHEELIEEGSAVVELDPSNFQAFLKENELAFIDMYAPWCIWCQRLKPTWEKFAQEIEEEEIPVGVGELNCVDHHDLCAEQQVRAFPTLRWYNRGQAVMPDYKMDRTVQALVKYAERKVQADEKYKDYSKNRPDKAESYVKSRPENPGCQVSGHLMVNRVPGNFHIEAKSKSHNLNAAMTNLTHQINHLSFGEPLYNNPSRKTRRILKQLPEEHKQFSPMDNALYPSKQFHQAYHHYIKVVSTHLNMGSETGVEAQGYNSMLTYQFLEQSQLVYYNTADVPEARFSYDLSPMSVVVQKESRKWYDYLTSLCAIIGGTFTTLGLIDATLYKVFKPKKL
eukprot:CAMPEP_0185731170 /NCGR_PEP_ID=MMETSP1171-20130828/12050_1 /TAXON_ID=374046 /ORGANISM="Helicotheca tamensis, Strain CCMP826" /LENGTH=433 /DNA_ID=CAMNT_0028400377 /DNA_START=239 /DNA_END=1540 /DNA_ORIENTATION=-